MKPLNLNPPYLFSSSQPGPKVVINAGLHGNEITGFEVVKRLINAFQGKIMNLIRGELIFTFGHPEAIEKNQRYLQVDGNRCFGQIPPEGFDQNTCKWKRALELKQFWGSRSKLFI